MSPNFSAMNKSILDYINAKIPKDTNKAQIGVVSGDRVIIGNNSFPYTPTVDMFFGDKSRVACIRPDNSNSVAVVGVL